MVWKLLYIGVLKVFKMGRAYGLVVESSSHGFVGRGLKSMMLVLVVMKCVSVQSFWQLQ